MCILVFLLFFFFEKDLFPHLLLFNYFWLCRSSLQCSSRCSEQGRSSLVPRLLILGSVDLCCGAQVSRAWELQLQHTSSAVLQHVESSPRPGVCVPLSLHWQAGYKPLDHQEVLPLGFKSLSVSSN